MWKCQMKLTGELILWSKVFVHTWVVLILISVNWWWLWQLCTDVDSILANSENIPYSILAIVCRTLYSYWLGSRTTAVLFDQRTDLLPEAAGLEQQNHSRAKHNCFCSKSKSITLTYRLDVFSILVRQVRESRRLLDFVIVNIRWLIEPMKMRPSVKTVR